MARPTYWEPLGWTTDPIPGDPAMVRLGADVFGSTATTIQHAADQLSKVTDDILMCSEAIDEFKKKAGDLRTSILKTKSRYGDAADALRTYARALSGAQTESASLLAQAQSVYSDRQTTVNGINEADNRAYAATDPAEHTLAQADANRLRTTLHSQDGKLSGYRAELARVIADRDAAGNTAAASLKKAEENSAVGNDSTWDKIRDVVDKICDFIVKWSDKITAVLDTLSTVLTIVGFIAMLIPGGQLIGGALLTAGRIAGVASTAIKAVKFVAQIERASTGRGSWKDVIATAATAVVSAGVGKLAGKLTSSLGNKLGSKLINGRMKSQLGARKWGSIKGGVVRQGKSLDDRAMNIVTGRYDSKLGKIVSNVKKFTSLPSFTGTKSFSKHLGKWESINSYVFVHPEKFDFGSRLVSGASLYGSSKAGSMASSFVTDQIVSRTLNPAPHCTSSQVPVATAAH